MIGLGKLATEVTLKFTEVLDWTSPRGTIKIEDEIPAPEGIGGVVAVCSAYNRKVVGSIPGSALLIPEVNVVDIQLRALLGLCSLLVHSAKYAGNCR